MLVRTCELALAGVGYPGGRAMGISLHLQLPRHPSVRNFRGGINAERARYVYLYSAYVNTLYESSDGL